MDSLDVTYEQLVEKVMEAMTNAAAIAAEVEKEPLALGLAEVVVAGAQVYATLALAVATRDASFDANRRAMRPVK